MPKGEPEAGDQGLDRTQTWGRTYWGGALFCLVADLQIRERTRDTRSLRDALRAIDAASGGIAASWSMARVIEVGDAATGVPVLRELYDRMSNAPAPVDLDATWKRLGVVADGRGITLDPKAPLASIRDHWLAP
jgi:predicted metalloprotease with PDZ domain